MNILDIIILVIVFIGFILGFKDGFVRKLVGLVGFALAIFLSIKFAVQAGKIIESISSTDFYLAEIMGGVIIFILIIIIFAFLKRVIHPFDKVNNFINQLIGGIVGGIQILYFASAVFFLLHIFNVPEKSSADKSYLYNKVYSIIPVTIDYISNYISQPKELIKEYINDKDTLK